MADTCLGHVGDRYYETGVDHGVLYIPDALVFMPAVLPGTD